METKKKIIISAILIFSLIFVSLVASDVYIGADEGSVFDYNITSLEWFKGKFDISTNDNYSSFNGTHISINRTEILSNLSTLDFETTQIITYNGTQVIATDGTTYIFGNTPLNSPINKHNTIVGNNPNLDMDSIAGRNNFYGYFAGADCKNCSKNQAFGVTALANIINGNENVAVGNQALSSVSATNMNGTVAIGYQSGTGTATGSYNVFIGYQSGYYAGSQDNVLYIHNNRTTEPLIYGEFDNRYLKINGELNVTESLEAEDYFSGNGNQGITQSLILSPTCNATVEDGLIVGYEGCT